MRRLLEIQSVARPTQALCYLRHILFCLILWPLGSQTALANSDSPTAKPSVHVYRSALSVASRETHFPIDQAAQTVSLPDDWFVSRPREERSVWYRITFEARTSPDHLLAAYVERACSSSEVYLNGFIIHRSGSMREPVAGNCYYPRLIVLPAGLLRAEGNVLDLKVQGLPLQKVSARQRSGGLSEIQIGPYTDMAEAHSKRLFWNVSIIKIITIVLAVLGLFMLYLWWVNRQKAYMLYFSLMILSWVALSARLWAQELPFDSATTEPLICVLSAVLTGLAVQFLLSYCNLRSRTIEICLLLQCLLVPSSLLLAGPYRVFVATSAWFLLMFAEVLATIGIYLYTTWRNQRDNFWSMAAILVGVGALIAIEIAIQYNVLHLPHTHVLQYTMPLVFIVIGMRELQKFGSELRAAEIDHSSLESRVAEATAEVERNFAQMAELRVEQVTEKERKRIAGDLHDDLGAKLLTIVHTSESERISSLAREALEEMRLSVRGLTGRPLPAADALADWRAETVSRLGQAGIEVDWRSPHEDVTQKLSARAFVQTTRILREAISNIIKHSGATLCIVRCGITEQDLELVVQDNGRGIPMELDGKLDRGHGMASMKHRAKQMQGQCLVESGPGYGTVIRLTLPL